MDKHCVYRHDVTSTDTSVLTLTTYILFRVIAQWGGGGVFWVTEGAGSVRFCLLLLI